MQCKPFFSDLKYCLSEMWWILRPRLVILGGIAYVVIALWSVTMPTLDEQDELLVANREDDRRPVIGFGRRRNFSNHYCVGPHLKATDSLDEKRDGQFQRLMRSCHFTDVCFHETGALMYFAPENKTKEEDLQTVIRGQDRWKGPDHNKEMYWGVPDDTLRNPAKGWTINEERWLKVVFEKQRPPECVWANAPIAIPYLPSHISNFGHNLLDNVMTFFRLMKMFDLYTHQIDFLPLRMNDSTMERDGTVLSKVLDPFVQTMENSAFSGSLSNVVNGSSCTCFENVLSGKYFHTDHGADESIHGRLPSQFNPFWVGRGDLLRDYRDAYMIRAGVDPIGVVPKSKNQVLLLTRTSGKGSNHAVLNHTSVLRSLQNCTRGIAQIEIMNPELTSMKDQITMAASSKVMVAMRGGSSLLSLFLPKGAAIILLDRGNNSKAFDDMLYDNVPYLFVWSEAVASSKTNANGDIENGYNMENVCQQVIQGIRRYDLGST